MLYLMLVIDDDCKSSVHLCPSLQYSFITDSPLVTDEYLKNLKCFFFMFINAFHTESQKSSLIIFIVRNVSLVYSPM